MGVSGKKLDDKWHSVREYRVKQARLAGHDVGSMSYPNFSSVPQSDFERWTKEALSAHAKKSSGGDIEVNVPSRIRVSDIAKQRYKDIQGAPVKRLSGELTGRAPAQKRETGVEKTRNEMIAEAEKNAWKCFGCGHEFGGYWKVGSDYKKLTVEHGHITKTRKEGGKAEHDYPVCPVCQKLQGRVKGMSLDDFQTKAKEAIEQREYKYVPKITEG